MNLIGGANMQFFIWNISKKQKYFSITTP